MNQTIYFHDTIEDPSIPKTVGGLYFAAHNETPSIKTIINIISDKLFVKQNGRDVETTFDNIGTFNEDSAIMLRIRENLKLVNFDISMPPKMYYKRVDGRDFIICTRFPSTDDEDVSETDNDDVSETDDDEGYRPYIKSHFVDKVRFTCLYKLKFCYKKDSSICIGEKNEGQYMAYVDFNKYSKKTDKKFDEFITEYSAYSPYAKLETAMNEN